MNEIGLMRVAAAAAAGGGGGGQMLPFTTVGNGKIRSSERQ